MASDLETPGGTVEVTVKANGSEIPGTYQVTQVLIENHVNRIPICEVTLTDGSAAKEDFPVSDSSTFVPGQTLEVLAGYNEASDVLFSGIILEQNLHIGGHDSPTLHVIAKDKAVKMTVGRKNNLWLKEKDNAIIEALISNNGLSASVSSTSNEYEQVVQFYTTDWDFMMARAEVNGMVVLVDAGKVTVQAPSDSTGDAGTVSYGDDVYSFDAELNAQYQYPSVQSASWSIADQSVQTSSATPEDYGTGNLSTSKLADVLGIDNYQLQTGGFVDSGDLSTWAKGVAVKSEFAKVRGEISFQGQSKPKPGMQLTLAGMGDRFNGKVYLAGVAHNIENGLWVTTCTLGLSHEMFASQTRLEAPVASGLLPGIQGLQVGKVKKINDDPDNNFRVQIELPLLQSSETTVWARLATFYASNGFGAFFYPEVGDEVVVGFFNDDPRYPVILGSMYSSSLPAPETPEEQNNLKEILTREKMKVSFDEEKKVITITTPGENEMIFSDEEKSITLKDQNGNKIVMNEEGIEINSPKMVTITGTEKVSASGGEVTLTGDEKLSASAPESTVSGDMSLSLSGGAEASLQADGELSVKGAMVMIN